MRREDGRCVARETGRDALLPSRRAELLLAEMDVLAASDLADALDGGRTEILEEGLIGALADGRIEALEGALLMELIVTLQPDLLHAVANLKLV